MKSMSHDELKDYFLNSLKRRIPGIEVCGWSDDLTVELKYDGLERQIYLGNKIKDYEQRNDIAVIDGFVEHIANLNVEKTFDKDYILTHLLVMIQPSDLAIRDAVSYDHSQQTKVFIVYQEGDDGGLHFLLQSDMQKHGFQLDELVRVATAGIDREIARSTVKEAITSWGSYFYFETAKEYLKASFILGSTVLGVLRPHVQDPVIMISNRDCLYATDAKNTDLISRIATICVSDHGNVGYPISTESFGVRNGRIVALGAFK